MVRKIITAYISLAVFFTIIAISCNIFEDDCGPFDSKFKTIGFITELNNISIIESPNLNIQYSTLEKDSVRFNEISISMFPVGKSYSTNLKKKTSFLSTNVAFACSPVIPVSEEIVTGIEIFSDKNFNSEYTSGNNLAELFDVVVLYRSSDYQRYDLNEFVSSEPNVPDEIFLLLKSAPETTDQFQFKIQYSQDGIDMDFHEFTTNRVVIIS